MRSKIAFILFLTLFFSRNLLAHAADPVTKIQSSEVITYTIPELVHGQMYDIAISNSLVIVDPIDNLVDTIADGVYVSYNPVVYASEVGGKVVILWNYFEYFDYVAPGLVSFKAVLYFYFVILTIKTLISLVRYVKQIIPFN